MMNPGASPLSSAVSMTLIAAATFHLILPIVGRRCDHQRYAWNGCEATATPNLVCNRTTDRCQCLVADFELHFDRLCLPRRYFGESCYFSRQCHPGGGASGHLTGSDGTGSGTGSHLTGSHWNGSHLSGSRVVGGHVMGGHVTGHVTSGVAHRPGVYSGAARTEGAYGGAAYMGVDGTGSEEPGGGGGRLSRAGMGCYHWSGKRLRSLRPTRQPIGRCQCSRRRRFDPVTRTCLKLRPGEAKQKPTVIVGGGHVQPSGHVPSHVSGGVQVPNSRLPSGGVKPSSRLPVSPATPDVTSGSDRKSEFDDTDDEDSASSSDELTTITYLTGSRYPPGEDTIEFGLPDRTVLRAGSFNFYCGNRCGEAAFCDIFLKRCRCLDSSWVLDGASNTCSRPPLLNYNRKCASDDDCDGENLICSVFSVNKRCICVSLHYFNPLGQTCDKKKAVGVACKFDGECLPNHVCYRDGGGHQRSCQLYKDIKPPFGYDWLLGVAFVLFVLFLIVSAAVFSFWTLYRRKTRRKRRIRHISRPYRLHV